MSRVSNHPYFGMLQMMDIEGYSIFNEYIYEDEDYTHVNIKFIHRETGETTIRFVRIEK